MSNKALVIIHKFCYKVKVLVAHSCPTLWSSMVCSPPGSSVHGFSRQEYWSGLPFPPPRDLPDPEVGPHLLCLLHWQECYLPLAPPGKPQLWTLRCMYLFELVFLFSSGKYPGVELLDHMVVLWYCLALGLEWKRTFSGSVATAEFSQFADILSAAL